MIDEAYERIALEEKAELIKIDIPSLNRFTQVEKRYELYVPYKGIVIEVKNSHSPDPVGSFHTEFFIGEKRIEFEIYTKSHLIKLLTFSKSITKIKSNEANLIRDIKSNEWFIKVEDVIVNSQFEPVIYASTSEGVLTLKTEYHTLLQNKTSFIKPMLEFYKFLIDCFLVKY